MFNRQVRLSFLFVCAFCATLMVTACDKGGNSFSMLPDSQSFGQSTYQINNKIDVLWVVDNSASMLPLQTTLVRNFNNFITTFQGKGYDFHIAVTSSDAYLSNAVFLNNPSVSKFRDGYATHSGVFMIDNNTPNLVSTFVTNASLGQDGSSDERVFSSFKESLNNSLNVGFLRSDAFLAVIILSDEDDFSGNSRGETRGTDHDYNATTLDTVASYETYLNQLTSSTTTNRRYNVSAITVLDSTCLATHSVAAPSSIIGKRYMQIANDTNGVLGSICDADYSTSVASIQQKVIELSTQFSLTRVPDPTTIVIAVDGVTVPESATDGWTYDATANAISFHGAAVPSQGANIAVNFTPLGIKE